MQAETFSEASDMNLDAINCLPPERICKILSDNPNSSVEASLSHVLVEVPPELVVEVLKKLSNAGVLALSFFRWAEKQKGFKYSTESYNALIEALGKIRQFKMVWNLVDDMKHKKLLAKDTFALVARRYARARKVKEAVETFEKMERFGMKLEVLDYNRLIDILSKSRCIEKAQDLFDKMKNERFTPDVKSYTILLEGWGQQQNLLRLNEVYREMKDEGFEPDVVTYGIIISAHCKARKYDEAVGFYHEMEAKNLRPTPHIFCTLINGLGSEKRLDEALEFFEKSKISGFPLEAPTYNAVIGAYCWSVRMHDAYKMVDEMKKCGVGPNSRTFDIILHHLIKARRKKEAYSVFQRMSSQFGCEPTVSTYEIIVRMFCNEDRVDMAIRVWEQMKVKGILPVMHMFCTLINALCLENKLDDACKYFQEMLDVGIRPPGPMFSNLKQALLDGGREDTVKVLALKIDKLRKTPLIATEILLGVVERNLELSAIADMSVNGMRQPELLSSFNSTSACPSTPTTPRLRVASSIRSRSFALHSVHPRHSSGSEISLLSPIDFCISISMLLVPSVPEQVNTIAHLAFNTVGTLQRDAPPNRLSPNYPEPPAHPTEDAANFAEQPKLMSAALIKAAKQEQGNQGRHSRSPSFGSRAFPPLASLCIYAIHCFSPLPRQSIVNLGTTGFQLSKASCQTFQAPTGCSGRLGNGTYATSDYSSGGINCGGIGATLAKFTLDSSGASQDYYDVSLNGYNLPMMVEAKKGSSGSCMATGCMADLNQRYKQENDEYES
ncbi:pentatricopeptide repeat-containing protein [Senna tora]|uniref:Pentatricopeptide repeat-containing protein n=1 Tax=Senna tora TaxID=362788 RepID=A0A834U1A3_9FABA|nr:pentatricopeptide repeat-containing protein [Senna tora]